MTQSAADPAGRLSLPLTEASKWIARLYGWILDNCWGQQWRIVNGKLQYPDGTLVRYDLASNCWLPSSIRNRNGDLINRLPDFSNHEDPPNYFPIRWARDQITDALGRVIQFRYSGDTGFPADSTGEKPQFALAAITAPDEARERLCGPTITLQYNFNS